MAGDSSFGVFWEKVRRDFVLAVKSLWLHKLRAALSVLGIVIGTAAVISLMAFGEGNMQDALEDIRRMGATNIIIRSVKPSEESVSQRTSFIANYGLTYGDFERFQVYDSVVGSVPMRIFEQKVRRLEHSLTGRVVGTTADYQKVNQIKMALGRFLMDADESEAEAVGDDSALRNVVVLGSTVAETLFPFENPLGKSIVLNNHHFVVVGVLADRMPTGASGATGGEVFNRDVYIPLSTCRARYGSRVFFRTAGQRGGEQVELHQITLTIADMDHVRGVGEAVRDLLERTHPKKDWTVTIPLDRLEEAERARARGTLMLVMIAGISLLVGGIGIMNIMVATVTERTREIGIRRALGAKRRDITIQFLIEAVVQTTLGGMIGVLMGLAVVFGVPFVAGWFDWVIPAKLHVLSIFLSVAVSIFVGVLFGWYPALRASSLDPIEALRHE